MLSRFLGLSRAMQLKPTVISYSSRRFLPSWGQPIPPPDRKEIETRVIKSLATHDKVDQSQVSSLV